MTARWPSRKGFADYHDCLFVISTHIVEVGVALQGHPNIRFVYMPTVMEGPYPPIPTGCRKVSRKTGRA